MDANEALNMKLPEMKHTVKLAVRKGNCTREHLLTVTFVLSGFTIKGLIKLAEYALRVDFQRIRERKNADEYIDSLVTKAKSTNGEILWKVTPEGSVDKAPGASQQAMMEMLMKAGLTQSEAIRAIADPSLLMGLLNAKKTEATESDEDEDSDE